MYQFLKVFKIIYGIFEEYYRYSNHIIETKPNRFICLYD